VSGDDEGFADGDPRVTSDNEGNLAALFLGYNLQRGSVVFGAELGVSGGTITFENINPLNKFDGMVDLKARIGYATGKVLVYGSLGYVRTDRSFAGPVSNDPIATTGVSFGLGVDAMVGERLFVGLEALQRNLTTDEGDVGGFPSLSFDNHVNTVSLRVGYRF
jgi:hypothetical protein